MYKDFEDFWKNSGILDTDSYRCIAETYEFTKDNIPQAFKSFGRNCYTFGREEAFDIGKRYGSSQMIEMMLEFLDMLKTADDISVVRKMIDSISKRYEAKIEKDEFGFPVEKT